MRPLRSPLTPFLSEKTSRESFRPTWRLKITWKLREIRSCPNRAISSGLHYSNISRMCEWKIPDSPMNDRGFFRVLKPPPEVSSKNGPVSRFFSPQSHLKRISEIWTRSVYPRIWPSDWTASQDTPGGFLAKKGGQVAPCL